jgi:hypothetical protein
MSSPRGSILKRTGVWGCVVNGLETQTSLFCGTRKRQQEQKMEGGILMPEVSKINGLGLVQNICN